MAVQLLYRNKLGGEIVKTDGGYIRIQMKYKEIECDFPITYTIRNIEYQLFCDEITKELQEAYDNGYCAKGDEIKSILSLEG